MIIRNSDTQDILRDIYQYFTDDEQNILDGDIPLELLNKRDIYGR